MSKDPHFAALQNMCLAAPVNAAGKDIGGGSGVFTSSKIPLRKTPGYAA